MRKLEMSLTVTEVSDKQDVTELRQLSALDDTFEARNMISAALFSEKTCRLGVKTDEYE